MQSRSIRRSGQATWATALRVPRTGLRVRDRVLQAIDDWRSGERDKPTRSAAICWLIGQGLQVESNKDRKQT